MLGDRGVGAALKEVARGSAMPVSVRDGGAAASRSAIETTVYFCCLESLQNAAKHARRGAAVRSARARTTAA